MKFSKARSVLFLVGERLYIHLNKKTVKGLLGIGDFVKFKFKNTPLIDFSKANFTDSKNKVFD
jgi:hypothetical protein